MASLHKQKTKGGESWRIQFTDSSGKRQSVWLGSMPRKTADTIRSRIEEILVCQRTGVSVSPETATWIGKITIDLHEKLAAIGLFQNRKTTTIGEFIEQYLKNLKGAESTITNYTTSAENLYKYFGKDRLPVSVSKNDAEKYKKYLQTRGRIDGNGAYGQNSVWKKLQHAKVFFREMKEAELIEKNPFERVSEPKINDVSRKSYISEEYTFRAMEYAPTWEWKLIIALWRFGGLRRASEPLRLKWSDVLWDKSLMLVNSSKTKSSRFVPIFPEIREPLERVFEQAEPGETWVIVKACPITVRKSPNRARGLRGCGLGTLFDKICTKAGLPIIPMMGNNMRASCEKDLYSGKYPELRGRIDLIAQILGHSPQVALEYYRRFNTDDLNDLTASFSKLPDFSSKTSVSEGGLCAIGSGAFDVSAENDRSKLAKICVQKTVQQPHATAGNDGKSPFESARKKTLNSLKLQGFTSICPNLPDCAKCADYPLGESNPCYWTENPVS